LLTGVTSVQNGQDGVRLTNPSNTVTTANSVILGNGGYGMEIDVNTPATDLYVAPSTVVLGNSGGNYIVYKKSAGFPCQAGRNLEKKSSRPIAGRDDFVCVIYLRA
jgi:hypothetical protein